uniref:Uncharacterized protein n=1 Tax=Cacopsylla melanoneura TaxID=428564 RepID=A0A8D9B4W4_9HEMI
MGGEFFETVPVGFNDERSIGRWFGYLFQIFSQVKVLPHGQIVLVVFLASHISEVLRPLSGVQHCLCSDERPERQVKIESCTDLRFCRQSVSCLQVGKFLLSHGIGFRFHVENSRIGAGAFQSTFVQSNSMPGELSSEKLVHICAIQNNFDCGQSSQHKIVDNIQVLEPE